MIRATFVGWIVRLFAVDAGAIWIWSTFEDELQTFVGF